MGRIQEDTNVLNFNSNSKIGSAWIRVIFEMTIAPPPPKKKQTNKQANIIRFCNKISQNMQLQNSMHVFHLNK